MISLPIELIEKIFTINHKSLCIINKNRYCKGYMINKMGTERFLKNELEKIDYCTLKTIKPIKNRKKCSRMVKTLILDTVNDEIDYKTVDFRNCTGIDIDDNFDDMDDDDLETVGINTSKPLDVLINKKKFPNAQFLWYEKRSNRNLQNDLKFIQNWSLKSVKVSFEGIVLLPSIIIESVKELNIQLSNRMFRDIVASEVAHFVSQLMKTFPNCQKLVALISMTEYDSTFSIDLSKFQYLTSISIFNVSYPLILPQSLDNLIISTKNTSTTGTIVFPKIVNNFCKLEANCTIEFLNKIVPLLRQAKIYHLIVTVDEITIELFNVYSLKTKEIQYTKLKNEYIAVQGQSNLYFKCFGVEIADHIQHIERMRVNSLLGYSLL